MKDPNVHTAADHPRHATRFGAFIEDAVGTMQHTNILCLVFFLVCSLAVLAVLSSPRARDNVPNYSWLTGLRERGVLYGVWMDTSRAHHAMRDTMANVSALTNDCLMNTSLPEPVTAVYAGLALVEAADALYLNAKRTRCRISTAQDDLRNGGPYTQQSHSFKSFVDEYLAAVAEYVTRSEELGRRARFLADRKQRKGAAESICPAGAYVRLLVDMDESDRVMAAGRASAAREHGKHVKGIAVARVMNTIWRIFRVDRRDHREPTTACAEYQRLSTTRRQA